jgi:5-methylcytosine-specific restriction endonuclease McrA
LCNLEYSNRVFHLNFSFFIDVNDVDGVNNENELDKKKESKRFLATNISCIRERYFRVTSQWHYSNIPHFKRYMEEKNIQPIIPITIENGPKRSTPKGRRKNNRYRGNAIGNVQNSLIRNILKNLGDESFNKDDWIKTKEYFNNKCAYCNSEGELVIEHAIPINKEKLGEHKIGNIIPSCKKCNSEKGDKDYREFLEGKIDAINKIEAYMSSRNYVPLENTNQLKMILNMAYEEVALVADRYIDIINELILKNIE